MQILVNGNQIDVEGITSDTTLFELLNTIESSLKGSGTTVVEILVDDITVAPDSPHDLQNKRVMDFERVEFCLASAKDMIIEAISDAEESLQHLEDLAVEISAELRLGNVQKAMKLYISFVDGIEWLSTILKNTHEAYALKMAETSLESERHTLQGRLLKQMAEVHPMQAAEDWVGMADILEYEFPEIFSDGKRWFKKLMNK